MITLVYCNTLQNGLICAEMLIASIIHIFAFSYHPYEDTETHKKTPLWRSFLRVINVQDVLVESHKHIVPTKYHDQMMVGKIGKKQRPGPKIQLTDLEQNISNEQQQEEDDDEEQAGEVEMSSNQTPQANG